MLTKLHLQNFRGFEDHLIPFHPTTIVVGRNNAGKSTIVEALRLLSIVTSRYQSLNYQYPPDWVDVPKTYRGVSPSLKNMGFNLDTIFHRYKDPPAVVTATFNTRHTIDIHIGPEGKIYAVIKKPEGTPITSKGEAMQIGLPSVSTLPQVGPLSSEENILLPEYVSSAMMSSLAPLHFRNQLHLLYDLYGKFKETSESTWPGLKIVEFNRGDKYPGDRLNLLLRDGDFVGEVGLMGHGLQMWLQTMWFLTRSGSSDTVVLDEPDVYMHADLQRKLIRFLRGRYKQIIIATHSIEIMAEVEGDQILVVDRSRKESTFTTSLPAVQRVVDKIGSVHNLQLARLWTSRRCLLVEGKDIKFLKRFQDILYPNSQKPFDTIPNMSIGGWGGWNYALGSSMILKNAIGEDIITYCILDSDYHTPNEIKERVIKAKEVGVQLHIWSSKEIENYLLVPSAIQRCILNRIKSDTNPPNTKEIAQKIDQIAQNLKQNVILAISDILLPENKKGGVSTAYKKAEEMVKEAWKTEEGRLSKISGKETLSLLSAWSQTEFGVSLNDNKILQELKPFEIALEVTEVVKAIEKGQKF